jgi:alpha-amylase
MKKIILTISAVLLCAGIGSLRAQNTDKASAPEAVEAANAPKEELPTNIGVPAECEDVMLQAFYWDSYKNSAKYGRTKWMDLLADTTAISSNFNIVWFPPSASSTGGVGYYHACLSNQRSSWGEKSTQVSLIGALHRGGVKVLADIVINHRGNKSSWCDFFPDDFGDYGQFQFTEQHICSGDECFTKSESTCYGSTNKGAADTGTNDAGCRDLDHSNEYVQSWAKAYVRWMRDTMKYDGFRYDMTLGYAGEYLSMYNEASNPYVSVSEYWESISKQMTHLEETHYNTMVFDFPMKFVMGNAIPKGYLSLLKNSANSLRGKGLAKYAVTFVDNHDTFERNSYGSNQFAGQFCNLSDATIRSSVLQAYAYILMMPGIPCVFYPHWKSYPEEINQLIAIRKTAGIHSESLVEDETGNQNKYSATINGHRRRVYLRLGSERDKTQPANTYNAMEGNGYTIYVESPEGIETVPDVKRGEKFMKNGQLYIRHGEKTYDAMGRVVEGEN